MEEVTLDELVKRFNVLDERLDEPCIDSYLIAIAIYLTTWKTAAPRLGLKQAEIEAIESDARSTEEMRQKTLQKWADKFAHKATYRRLITVFLEVGDAKLASKACELLSCRQCTCKFANLVYSYGAALWNGFASINEHCTCTYIYMW